MKLLNLAARLLAIGTLSLGAISFSFANTSLADFNANNINDVAYSFTGGVGGTLQTVGGGFDVSAGGPQTSTTNATFILSSITELTAATPDGLGGYEAGFGGGTFQLVENGGPTLLSGTFSNAELFTFNTSDGIAASIGNVTYNTSDQYAQEFLSKHGSAATNGNFQFLISAANPGLTNTGSGGGFGAFNSGGGVGTFAVVPESNGSLLILAALAPVAIVGLLLRRRHSH